MGTWYTTIATATEAGGTDLVDDIYDIIISPVDPDTGIHSGTYIQASNFTIGGSSSESSEGSGVWTGGNVDAGVASVTFTDLGTAGQINNTVRARVKMGTTTPAVDTSFHIDIDEKAADGTTQVLARIVYFFVTIPYSNRWTHYFYYPWSNNAWVPQPSTTSGFVRTLVNEGNVENDGFYKYRFAGTINNYYLDADYQVTKIAAFRTNPDTGQLLDPLPSIVESGDGAPDFTPHSHYFTYNTVSSVQGWFVQNYYSDAYSTTLGEWHAPQTDVQDNPLDLPGVPYALTLTISYNPPDMWQGWLLDNYLGWLGHTINWDFDTITPTGGVSFDEKMITSVKVPSVLRTTSGYQNIVVRGTPDAQYELSVTERTSLKDFTPVRFYSFHGVGRLTTTQDRNIFQIGANGRNNHRFILPEVTEKKMYDIYVSPLGDTKIKEGLPTKLGDKTFEKTGYNTLTIRATAGTEANWDLSGTGTSVRDVVISRKA